MTQRSSWWHKGKIALLVLTSSVLSGEIALRVYHAFEPLFIFHDDSYNRFRGRPYAEDWNFTLNSRGFKDTEFTEPREGALRIVAIGDSFTFGVVPYQYNFLTLLDDELDNEAQEVEIFNMGIPAVGPPIYLSLLVDEGMALKPDLVLVSLYVGNDFYESRKDPRPRALHTYSYLASLAVYLTRVRSQFEGVVPHGSGFYLDHWPTLSEDAYFALVRKRGFVFLEGHPHFRPLADEALSYLSQIRDLCKQRGISFLVVVIPDEVQIDPQLQRKILASYPPALQTLWRTTQPNQLLAQRFDELGIESIDLLEVFQDAARTRRLYRLRDSHWNIPGNRLAADTLKGPLQSWIDRQKTTGP